MNCKKLLTSIGLIALLSYSVFGEGVAEAKNFIKARQLEKLELGMTKAEVKKAVGSPQAARGAIVNKYKQTIEVWEYRVRPAANLLELMWTDKENYHLYFYEDTLVQWGKSTDWPAEQKQIYEVKIDYHETKHR